MRATINASPLIFLAKLDRISLLNELLTEFRVSDIVWEEVVKKGLDYRYAEAESARRLVNNRIMKVEKGKAKKLAEKFGIHTGEASTMLLAKELNFEYVIADDRAAIKVAKVLGLKPLSTPFILLKALKEHRITYEEFTDLFEKLIAFGYHISLGLYREILERAEKMKH